MSDHVPDLRGGSHETAKFILGPVMAAAVIVGGLVWHAAQMPSKDDFRQVQQGVQQLRERMGVQEVRSNAMQSAVERIERRQESGTDEKVDLLIRQRRR